MVEVYVIESVSDATWYTGKALSAKNRLVEHNLGKNRFTKGHLPWKLIYIEPCKDWATGRMREKYLTHIAAKKQILTQNAQKTIFQALPKHITI